MAAGRPSKEDIEKMDKTLIKRGNKCYVDIENYKLYELHQAIIYEALKRIDLKKYPLNSLLDEDPIEDKVTFDYDLVSIFDDLELQLDSICIAKNYSSVQLTTMDIIKKETKSVISKMIKASDGPKTVMKFTKKHLILSDVLESIKEFIFTTKDNLNTDVNEIYQTFEDALERVKLKVKLKYTRGVFNDLPSNKLWLEIDTSLPKELFIESMNSIVNSFYDSFKIKSSIHDKVAETTISNLHTIVVEKGHKTIQQKLSDMFCIYDGFLENLHSSYFINGYRRRRKDSESENYSDPVESTFSEYYTSLNFNKPNISKETYYRYLHDANRLIENVKNYYDINN